MNKVAVVTDSTACLPKDLAKQHNIIIVPMSIICDGKAYRDEVDITPTEVYRLLENGGVLPTTSAPPPGAYVDAFRELGSKAEGILCITLAQSLSTVFQSATQAKEIVRESLPDTQIVIMDSRNAVGAQGLIVLAAARAAASGATLEEVMQIAENTISKVSLMGLLDSLEYLARGGRIPRAAAWVGGMLKFKPIFTLSNGKPSLLTAARTRSHGVERMLTMMRHKVKGRELRQIIVMHANVLNEAEKLKERLCAEFSSTEVYIKDFSPVMGVHTGPGVLGIAFCAD